MLKAVIFDLDGVISDTQNLHSEIEVAIFRKYGVEVSKKRINEKYAGVPCKDFFREIFAQNNISTDIEKVVKEKQDLMLRRSKGNILPMPGALKLIAEADQRGLGMAVATSSPKKLADLILTELDLTNVFKTVVTIEDVKNGKPDPEIFLLAAKKLGVKPQECIVIEDGRSGMLAAKRAGMRCVGLVKDKSKKDYSADILVESLNEINDEKIYQH